MPPKEQDMETQFTVEEKDAGERLDKWVCSRLSGFSRNQVKELLDGGRVLINRRRVVIAGWELEAGDEVEVRLPPGFEKRERAEKSCAGGSEEAAPSASLSMERAEVLEEKVKIRSSLERYFERQRERKKARSASEEEGKGGGGSRRADKGRRGDRSQDSKGRGRGQKSLEASESFGSQGRKRLKIYHEDRDVIVVEKPAGLLAVPSEKGERERDSLLGEIHSYMRRRHRGKHSFVGPLHRLDAETSGIMVFALSKDGRRLEQQFRDHSIRREYTAIVAGRMEEAEGIIDMPLEKGDFGGGKKVRRAEGGEGKKAVTEFRVKERYSNATLVELRVRTGRTHQIRVHLAEKGFPILGDKLYAERAASETPEFPRHALHANVLGFKHPSTKKKYSFHSGLPKDMRELIDSLRTGTS